MLNEHNSTATPIQNNGAPSPEEMAALAQVTLAKMRSVLELMTNNNGNDLYFLLIDLVDKASAQLEEIHLGEVSHG